MSDEDASWFENEPCHMLRDRVAVGHGGKAGEGIVFIAFELKGDTHVVGLTPERADHVAKQLRLSAGAARAFAETNPQEDE